MILLFLKRCPISAALFVIINSGSIENGRAKAKKTCELFIKLFNASCSSMILFPLKSTTQINTGTTEISRVTSRRSQIGIFIWTKPSIITCPVKVPVIVEFCPEASSATANKVDKAPVFATLIKMPLLIVAGFDKASYKPKNEGSLTVPVLKTATPMIKSRAFTRKAIDNWMLESQVVKRTALATSSSSSWLIFRVWETAEWRYKLWGITVAPIIPKAPVKGVCPPIAGESAKVPLVGTKPLITSPQFGLDKATW